MIAQSTLGQLLVMALCIPSSASQLSSRVAVVDRCACGRRDAMILAAVGASSYRLPATAAVAPANPLCDPSVSLVRSAKGQDITIVGTAHISEDSATLVQRVIQTVRPDIVMIELDESRAGKLIGARPRLVDYSPRDTAPATYSIGQVAGRVLRGDMREAGAEAVGAGLAALYRRLSDMGFQSGQEFVVAVDAAEQVGASLLLGDRDARETLRRLRDALGELVTNPPAEGTLAPPPAALQQQGMQEFTRDNVASAMAVLQQRENVRELTAYYKANARPLYDALIGERDTYMAQSLLSSGDGVRVVAVVGLAHVDGIAANIVRDGLGGGRVLPRPRTCVS